METIPVNAAKPADVANRAAASEIAELTDQLSKVYTSAIEDLTSVKDVPTAEAAAPKLERLSGTIDSLKPLIDKLPESGKSAIAAIQTKYFDRLKDLVEKVLSIPGVGEKLKPIRRRPDDQVDCHQVMLETETERHAFRQESTHRKWAEPVMECMSFLFQRSVANREVLCVTQRWPSSPPGPPG